jgi:hypothetical protein
MNFEVGCVSIHIFFKSGDKLILAHQKYECSKLNLFIILFSYKNSIGIRTNLSKIRTRTERDIIFLNQMSNIFVEIIFINIEKFKILSNLFFKI